MRDNGVLSYPRYQLRLPNITVGKEKFRSFTFVGIPSQEMSLVLYLEGISINSRDDADRLRTLDTQIRAQVVEEASALINTPTGGLLRNRFAGRRVDGVAVGRDRVGV